MTTRRVRRGRALVAASALPDLCVPSKGWSACQPAATDRLVCLGDSMREAGKPELKHFDKHIFDQMLAVKTTPKKILLNTEPKSEIGQQNVWTWIHEDVDKLKQKAN